MFGEIFGSDPNLGDVGLRMWFVFLFSWTDAVKVAKFKFVGPTQMHRLQEHLGMVVGPVVTQKELGEGEWCHETRSFCSSFL